MKRLIILSMLLAGAGCQYLPAIQSDVVALTPSAQEAIDLGLTLSGNPAAAALNDALIAPVIKAAEPGVTKAIENRK